jgi:hypothetical protein
MSDQPDYAAEARRIADPWILSNCQWKKLTERIAAALRAAAEAENEACARYAESICAGVAVVNGIRSRRAPKEATK